MQAIDSTDKTDHKNSQNHITDTSNRLTIQNNTKLKLKQNTSYLVSVFALDFPRFISAKHQKKYKNNK